MTENPENLRRIEYRRLGVDAEWLPLPSGDPQMPAVRALLNTFPGTPTVRVGFSSSYDYEYRYVEPRLEWRNRDYRNGTWVHHDWQTVSTEVETASRAAIREAMTNLLLVAAETGYCGTGSHALALTPSPQNPDPIQTFYRLEY